MAQRLIHVVLPRNLGAQVAERLPPAAVDAYWVASSPGSQSITSILTDSTHSGELMDRFEKTFAAVDGFRMALLPPLTASGLLLGAGFYHLSFMALLLFLTDIICINLAGIVTFFVRGISPCTWWDTDKARKATRNALALWALMLALLSVVIVLWAGN